jgi:hypothetical protein
MPFDIGGFIFNGDRIKNDARTGIVTNGLVLHLDASIPESYPLSGTSWFDLSGNGRTGTLTNGPIFNSGNGGSIVFDGVDDYTQIPIPTTSTTNVTIEVWVEVILGTNGAFFKVGDGCNGYAMGIGSTVFSEAGNNVIGLFPCVRWISTGVSYGSSGWKHCVMVLNASSVPTFYINGTTIGTFTGSGPATPTNSMFLSRNFGDEPEGASVRAYNGKISGTKFYNRALSTTEITQNFNATRTKFGV